MLVRVERLRRLPPPAVVILPSELAIDFASSLIVSSSISWNRTTGSLACVILSDNGLNGRRKIGGGFSLIVDVLGGNKGAENADRANGDRLGRELLRSRVRLVDASREYSWPW